MKSAHSWGSEQQGSEQQGSVVKQGHDYSRAADQHSSNMALTGTEGTRLNITGASRPMDWVETPNKAGQDH